MTIYRLLARVLGFKILAYDNPPPGDNPGLIEPIVGDMGDEGDPPLFLFSTPLVFELHTLLIVVSYLTVFVFPGCCVGSLSTFCSYERVFLSRVLHERGICATVTLSG